MCVCVCAIGKQKDGVRHTPSTSHSPPALSCLAHPLPSPPLLPFSPPPLSTLPSTTPTPPHRHDSGGDPEVIPKLTFEQFQDFHAKYYHPSNAR